MNLLPRKCKICPNEFTPNPKGYNALYCSKKCRNKAQKKLPYDPTQRNKTYCRIKNDPERYAIHLNTGRTGRKLIREWLAAYKLKIGCKDCGYKEFACALQLDHEDVKSISIADARSSIDRLKKEIEDGQCVVRCANCHSIKTWRERQK